MSVRPSVQGLQAARRATKWQFITKAVLLLRATKQPLRRLLPSFLPSFLRFGGHVIRVNLQWGHALFMAFNAGVVSTARPSVASVTSTWNNGSHVISDAATDGAARRPSKCRILSMWLRYHNLWAECVWAAEGRRGRQGAAWSRVIGGLPPYNYCSVFGEGAGPRDWDSSPPHPPPPTPHSIRPLTPSVSPPPTPSQYSPPLTPSEYPSHILTICRHNNTYTILHYLLAPPGCVSDVINYDLLRHVE